MTKEKPKETKHDHKDCDGDNPPHDTLTTAKAEVLRAVFAVGRSGTSSGDSGRIEKMEALTTLSTTVGLPAQEALKPVAPIGTVRAPIVRFPTMRTNHF